jgi:ABC-2 type transport system ATP-binding protein
LLLQVDQLRYSYGKRQAVNGVSFSVNPGEIFGLLGPNGAGKSTTLSCIAGLLKDWTGELTFQGRPFRPAVVDDDRRRLGIVPQELAIYENLDAAENLELFGGLVGLRGVALKESIGNQLALAGLEDRKRDLVKTYSGGMKRRLNLACGLLHNPPLVLLDEPTVGVDPQSRNHLFESLQRLRESGTSLLYTTHYMEEAERLCDRVAIMNEGQLIAIGTPSGLGEQVGVPGADLETIFLKLTGRSLRDE